MEIKNDDKTSGSRNKKQILFISGLILLSFLFYRLSKIKQVSFSNIISVAKETVKPSSKSLDNLPTLKIQIKKKHFLKIEEFVKETKKKTVITDKKFYPAVIKSDKDNVIPIRMRIKGDLIDHIAVWKKWSFRIMVKKKEHAYLGMRTFSIQHPERRSWLMEWWLIDVLRKKENVLAPRYDFVRLNLNGEDWGIYAYEEFFRKELLESQSFREGPIIKPNEELNWIVAKNADEKSNKAFEEIDYVFEPFEKGQIYKNPAMANLATNAISNLEQYVRGKRDFAETFHLKTMARYFAFCDLFTAHHGCAAWHNLRFYYNPIDSLLYPIHFDGNAGQKHINYTLAGLHPFLGKKIQDPNFYKHYYRELNRITSKQYLDQLEASYKPILDSLEKQLRTEFGTYKMDRTLLRESAKDIRKFLDQLPHEFTLKAFLVEKNKQAPSLLIRNLRSFPIEIVSIQKKYGKLWSDLELERKHPLVFKSYIRKSDKDTRGFHYQEIQLKEKVENIKDLKITYRLVGSDKIVKAGVERFSYKGKSRPTISRRDFLNSLKSDSFLEVVKGDVLRIKEGNWEFKEDIVIPKGFTLTYKGKKKTTLKFSDNAVFVSYSPLKIEGTPNLPIEFTSLNKNWPGLIVLNVDTPSFVKNAVFKNVSGIDRDGWVSPGGITFYENDVTFKNVVFEKSFGEDLVNVFRSRFLFEDCIVKGSFSDALDVDFGKGKILRTKFINAGNDAIDFSGSEVLIDNVVVNGAGDKGISSGEKSTVTIRKTNVFDANIGVASKDSSVVNITESSFRRSKLAGLAGFQKKGEYGSSKIIAKGVILENNFQDFLLEKNSVIHFDDKKIVPNDVRLREKIYE